MATFFVVRHGQDTDNAAGILNGHRDTELTSVGIEQAREVARKLGDRSVHVAYASPLKRAQATARIIADALGIGLVRSDPLLIERDYGVLTGKPIADIKIHASKIIESDGVTYFAEAEGAEGYPAVLARAKRFLREAASRHPGENVLIVTHAATGRMILAAHHGWTWEESLQRPRFANGEVLEFKRDP